MILSLIPRLVCLNFYISRFSFTGGYSHSSHNTHYKMVKYLNQTEAIEIDKQLFNKYKFSVDQLMELAGLSCANVIASTYRNKPEVLVCAGPGNNGGDGLVCARHLKLYGFSVMVYYPKTPTKELYINLLHQCKSMDITITETLPSELNFDLIVDAIFGFSYKPPLREMFVPAIKWFQDTESPIVSIDIPSGWDVEKGPVTNYYQPTMLISLTAPKLCAKYFTGEYHFLGGRFVPMQLAKEFDLNLPIYTGIENFVRLHNENYKED